MDDDPVDIKEILPEEWSPALEGVEMYWMAEIVSEFRTYEGLILTKDGPKGKILEALNIHNNEWEESIAPLTDTEEAIAIYLKGKKHSFEEFPFVEIESREQYEAAIGNEKMGPKDWSPKKKYKSEMWQGPGVYDFREHPPTRSYESVEVYEMAGSEERARQALETTYDDDYKKPMRKLIRRYTGIGGGDE